MLRKKFHFLFNKEKLIFLLLIFCFFLHSHSIIGGKITSLAGAGGTLPALHITPCRSSHDPSGPPIGLCPTEQAPESEHNDVFLYVVAC